MKKKFIREHTFKSHCWFVYDCTPEEFSEWVYKKWNYEMSTPNGISYGKHVMISNDKTQDWIIYWNSKEKGPTSIAHELIHLVSSIFQYFNIEFCDHTEEVFTTLHSYYYEEIIKILSKDKV